MLNRFLIETFSAWLVSLSFLGVFLIFLLTLPQIARAVSKFPKVILILFLLTLVGGSLIRFHWVPNEHRIFYDEDRYLSYAVTFAKFNKATSITLATPEKIEIGDPDPVARLTVPILNGWVLKLSGGADEANLFTTAKVFSVLQIILVFIFSYLLFRKPLLSFFSSFLIAFLPSAIYWSPSFGLDNYFVFFSLLAGIAALWYAKETKLKTGIFLVLSAVLLLFARLEAVIFFFLILALIAAYRKENGERIFAFKRDGPVMTILASILVFRVWLSLSAFTQPWCCGEATPLEIFTTSNIVRNTLPNLGNLFNRVEFPFLITILAAVPLLGEKNALFWPLRAWFIFYFLIYSFYFAGRFYTHEFSGSYGRYFLILVPPLVISASFALENLVQKIRGSTHPQRYLLLFLVLSLAMFFPAINSFKRTISFSEYEPIVERQSREVHRFLAEEMLTKTPPGSLVIHPLTPMVLLSGRSTAYLSAFFYDQKIIDYVARALKDGQEVYIFETQTCNAFPQRCEKILPVFKFSEPVLSARYTQTIYEMVKVELREPEEPVKSN